MSYYLTQSLHRALRHHPERIAVISGTTRMSFGQLADRVSRLATALRALGVQPGDRVSMLALNSHYYLEFYLGCFWAGAVACPLNTRWTIAEIANGLKGAGVETLIVDDHFTRIVADIRAIHPLRDVIHAGETGECDGLLGYEHLLQQALPMADVHRSGDDLAFLLYTGGTTGFPKGVMLSHANLAGAALGMSAMGCGSRGACLHAVPLFHMAGIQILFNHLIGGGTHIVLPSFQPQAMLHLLARERPQSTMLVPTMLQALIDHPDAETLDLSSLEQVFYGASPISEAMLQRAMRVLPKAAFVQGYGMTETGITLMLPACFHTVEGQRLGKLRAAGIAAPSAEVKIVDDVDMEQPRGLPGEILVRGPTVMRGYWNQPEQTEQALRGGWMHTGDVGLMDEDGFVFIVDRLKDMIVSGGENVYSTEVENALTQHPAVSSCAVIGVPDAHWGERVHAVVVLRPGSAITEAELIAHCKPLISAFKCPRSVEFREALPLSAAGKLLKNELRAPYWQGHQRRVA